MQQIASECIFISKIFQEGRGEDFSHSLFSSDPPPPTSFSLLTSVQLSHSCTCNSCFTNQKRKKNTQNRKLHRLHKLLYMRINLMITKRGKMRGKWKSFTMKRGLAWHAKHLFITLAQQNNACTYKTVWKICKLTVSLRSQKNTIYIITTCSSATWACRLLISRS